MPAAVYAESYANPQLLVETAWLTDHLNDPNLRIIDTRAQKDYQQGHVPNAVFFDRVKVWDTIGGIEGMLPPVDKVKASFEEAGINNWNTVVIYDDQGDLWAARLFWALEYLGHRDVRLLNGGWKKWKKEGRSVTTETPQVARESFKVELHPEKLATKEEILKNLDNPQLVILDARSPKEYTGEDKRSSRGGHIPGAINLNWVLNITTDDVQTFLPTDELAEMFEQEGVSKDKEVAALCQTGVRGAHSYFTLRLLGYENVKVYDGSWAEWGNDPNTPVVTGNSKR
jgi:thiosulfate/3-mercaptopyruvate sulfurtransferase